MADEQRQATAAVVVPVKCAAMYDTAGAQAACALCCSVSMLSALCMLTFMWLHVNNSTGATSLPWLIVFSPLILAAAAALIAALVMPLALPASLTPSFRACSSLGFGALAVLAICVRLAVSMRAPDGAPSPPLALPLISWTVALAPLAALLLVRFASTLVCSPRKPAAAIAAAARVEGGAHEGGGAALDTTDLHADAASARLFARARLPLHASALLELLLAGWSLNLLFERLEGGVSHSWWLIAAPLLALQTAHLVAGCALLGSVAKPTGLPSSAVDQVEWVRVLTLTLTLPWPQP